MIHEAIYDCTFCEKDIALPNDRLAVTKLEFVDDRSNFRDVKFIRVEFASCGDEQVLVSPPDPFDVVQEASEESFPASDSPAY